MLSLERIHEKLLEHRFNLYMISEHKNEQLIRPATHAEVALVDENYAEKYKGYLHRIPCPCVILINDTLLTIDVPIPQIYGRWENWREELPRYSEWINMKDNTERCNLCGSNIIFSGCLSKNRSLFCCKLHERIFHKLLETNDVCNLKHGIEN